MTIEERVYFPPLPIDEKQFQNVPKAEPCPRPPENVQIKHHFWSNTHQLQDGRHEQICTGCGAKRYFNARHQELS